jgi:hypothetical protein
VSDLIVNGEFTSDLSGWTVVAGAARSTAQYNVAPASCKLSYAGPPLGTYSHIHQQITVPAGGPFLWTLQWSMFAKMTVTNGWGRVHVMVGTVGIDPVSYLDAYYKVDTFDTWQVFSSSFVIAPSTSPRFSLITPLGLTDYVYLDSVSLTSVAYAPTTRLGAMWELQKRRRDWGGFKHATARYLEIVNFALAQAPLHLWRVDLDTSLTTVADTAVYSLAAITGIAAPQHVRRVWLHDGETPGQYLPLGNWEVREDWSGTPLARTLSLALDEIPGDAGRTIQVEYYRNQPELSDDEDLITTDWEWVMAKSMVLLLLEADPLLEDPQQIERDLKYWDAHRASRELVARGRRPASKARAAVW